MCMHPGTASVLFSICVSFVSLVSSFFPPFFFSFFFLSFLFPSRYLSPSQRPRPRPISTYSILDPSPRSVRVHVRDRTSLFLPKTGHLSSVHTEEEDAKASGIIYILSGTLDATDAFR